MGISGSRKIPGGRPVKPHEYRYDGNGYKTNAENCFYVHRRKLKLLAYNQLLCGGTVFEERKPTGEFFTKSARGFISGGNSLKNRNKGTWLKKQEQYERHERQGRVCHRPKHLQAHRGTCSHVGAGVVKIRNAENGRNAKSNDENYGECFGHVIHYDTMKTVYVAMSGGVDSSLAAALLKKKGHKVIGVFFKPWSPSGETADSEWSGFTAQTYCNWRQDRLDAMRVAAKLGIEFKTWDFSKEYGREVAQYMIDGYRAGITPNPDVMCNKEIKFGLFMEKALAEGADFIATGHYAIVKREVKSVKLLKAKDKNKDQIYFLWTLTQNQLKHVIFPIGDYTKPQVRRMAKRFGLPTAEKKDSQGVCFVGKLDMHDFLQEYIKPQKGDIKLGDKVIGTHDGAAYYTIGQRHGLNITIGGGPYYVVRKEGNIVYVEKSKIKSQKLKIGDVNWISGKPQLPLKAIVKIRYRGEDVPVVVNPDYSLSTTHFFSAPSPGQSAVLYRGSEVLGGGVIQ